MFPSDADSGGRRFADMLGELQQFTTALEPKHYASSEAAELTRQLARAEKLCQNAKVRMAARAAEGLAHRSEGQTSPGAWLAGLSGEGVGRATRQLDLARKLEAQPELEDAFKAGTVSVEQADLLSDALEAAPEAAGELLDAAQGESFRSLRDRCEQVKAAKATEEEARVKEERLRARRTLHVGTTREGAVYLRGELSPVDGAIVKAALERRRQEVFKDARRAGIRDRQEAYLADALVALCRDDASGSSSGKRTGAGAVVNLHVSLEALRRGHLEPGERCDIPGVGPVSLATCENMLGEAFLKLVINRGVDVMSVTHLGRLITAHQRTAIEIRDPECCVPGCGVRHRLEIDHIKPVTELGPTELDNLARLCRFHHYMKTHKGWVLAGRPGAWKWEKRFKLASSSTSAPSSSPTLATEAASEVTISPFAASPYDRSSSYRRRSVRARVPLSSAPSSSPRLASGASLTRRQGRPRAAFDGACISQRR